MVNTIQDAKQREQALNPSQSYIVQAPAGSGKTELLTQRFLVLLSYVNSPEEILAITFTKKAAAEMRARIIKTFQSAENHPEPDAPHAKKTWLLAKRALEQNKKLGWNLLSNPNRLRIQTIDSFNASLNKHLPILSHFGAPPEITDDPMPLYREAIQEFLTHLEENVEWADAIAHLLLHRDNNLNQLQNLLIKMLAKRDQWLPYMMVDINQPNLRKELENHLSSVVSDILVKLKMTFPTEHVDALLKLARYAAYHLGQVGEKPNVISCEQLTSLPGTQIESLNIWLGLSELLLTKDLKWRKSFDKRMGFPAPSNAANSEEKSLYKNMKSEMENLIDALSQYKKLHLALVELNYAPAFRYQDAQWETLNALYQVLRVAVAQLRVTFRNHNKIDYIENAQAALTALGPETAPTDLALSLDYQIKHILIDEFQDTSNSQFRLLEKLLAGWESNDGRTLFVVGDPMQSIYRFREAEVGLFIRARKQGICNVKLIPLTLSVNFRSTPTIVDWINTHFEKVLSPFEDIASGAVSYTHSVANESNDADQSLVKMHVDTAKDLAKQAELIVDLILQTKKEDPYGTIAILVRARTHLEYIIPHLKKANLSYRAIKIDPLDSRAIIQDLMALTKALFNTADRVAWLAILRSPFCGLTLSDLLFLARNNPYHTILESLKSQEAMDVISAEGKARLSRIIPILTLKLAERKRSSLRLWIESTWLALGGPACVEHAQDLEDAAAYFNLLEKLDVGGDLYNLNDLDNHVSKLFASPNNEADNSLQIMTIHNAKGLEFDTVILPYLERQAPHDDKQLLLWMEKPRDNARNALILAPVHAMGDDSDSIYNYIKEQNKLKSDNEMGRLLYVAATRAKKQLHLFFSIADKNEDNKLMDSNSMKVKSLLDRLWPAIKHEITLPEVITSTQALHEESHSFLEHSIKRLQLKWQNPIRVLASEISKTHQSLPGFQLHQNDPKRVGTLIHKIFEMISLHGHDWWMNRTENEKKLYLEKHLLMQGMLPAVLAAAVKTINQAISNTLQDKRGQWILHSHQNARSELALSALIDSEVKQLIVDRTFIDENGTRWIIDYKTTDHDHTDLESFLNSAQQEYDLKMSQYFQAFKSLENRPIKLGLYFPVIPAWHEWSYE